MVVLPCLIHSPLPFVTIKLQLLDRSLGGPPSAAVIQAVYCTSAKATWRQKNSAELNPKCKPTTPRDPTDGCL